MQRSYLAGVIKAAEFLSSQKSLNNLQLKLPDPKWDIYIFFKLSIGIFASAYFLLVLTVTENICLNSRIL